MNNYLGIDIGTSGCKAVVFNDAGRQLSASYREYNVISKYPGWAELDTDEVIARCFDVIRDASETAGAGSVKGIGISSQGEAFTLINKDGQALCNALVSSDIRANDQILPWTEEFGEEKLYNITGHTPHPMFSLYKLLWVRNNEPEIWSKAERILCFEDLLQYRLGISNPAMGWPLAGRTMLFDVVTHRWDGTILDRIGLDAKKLSKPMRSGSLAGYISPDMASALNLADDTFIVTGGHDQPCSGLGAGAVDQGIAVYSSGTVECITPAFGKPVFTEELRKSNLCTYDHTAPGMYATVAFSLTGGNVLKWFRDQFGSAEAEEAIKLGCNTYEVLMKNMPEEPSRLMVLPYFTPSGTPYFDVNVKGTVIGLDLSVTRGEILRALLEGVAFEIKLNIDILKKSGYEVKELRIIGGGSRSLKHVQLKADVTGMPITILDVAEAGCMGVAMLAKSHYDKTDVRDIARQWVKPATIVNPESGSRYDKKFQQYKELYHQLKKIYEKM